MKFEKIQSGFFFGFLGVATILFFWLVSNLSFSIFWAIFFTIVFYPLYERILKKTKNKKNLSAALTTVIIFVSISIPLTLTSYIVIDQIPKINKTLLDKKELNSIFQELPFKSEIDKVLIKNNIQPEEIQENISKSIKTNLKSISTKIIDISQNIFSIVMNLFLMLYIIFFGLRDGKQYLLRLSKILPLGDKTERRLFKKFSSIVRSIFKGTLIVSTIQGLLAGMLLFFAGFKAILIWTMVLIISAMIPAVGVGLILVPIAIFLFVKGSIGLAIMILVGLLFISLVDNILRPYLIGHETEIPDMLITISILAGLSLWGVTGLVIGPVIAGFFLTMWHLFEEKYNDNLDNNE